MTRFLLIRHALTDAIGRRLSGRTPGVSLNEQGRAQALDLSHRLSALPVSAIFSSPLERALETAAPLAEALHLQTILSGDFLEMDFGEWTNRTFEELRSDPQFRLFNSCRSRTRIPGGEMMSEAQTRMVAGLEKIRLQRPDQTVGVVSHADLIKSAIAWHAGIPLDLFHRIEISAASVSVIELSADSARILLVNDTGNLKAKLN